MYCCEVAGAVITGSQCSRRAGAAGILDAQKAMGVNRVPA
jgi:hypothetical protein